MPNLFRNPWIQSAGILVFAAAVFMTGQIYWINPGREAHENLGRQIPAKEAQVKQVLSRMPDLLRLNQSLQREEARLLPLRNEVAKLEKQMFSENFMDALAEKEGAKLEKTGKTPKLIYSQANYRLQQQGNYRDLLAFLNLLEAASPFSKMTSLVLEKTKDQVLLHADFSVLLNTQKEAREPIQGNPSLRLPALSRDPFLN